MGPCYPWTRSNRSSVADARWRGAAGPCYTPGPALTNLLLQMQGGGMQRVPATPGPAQHEGGLDLQQVPAVRPFINHPVSVFNN